MIVVAIVSVSGGVGKTTLAANLAAVAGTRGASVLVVEWDPANRLGFHLGVCNSIDDGWISACVHGSAWQEHAYRNTDNVIFMPFGHLTSADRTRFEQLLVDQPDWLYQHLHSIDLADDTLVFLDVERGPSVYMSQALVAADLALVTMAPSPCFTLEVDTFREETPVDDDLRVKYVLNFADPTRHTVAENTVALGELLGQDLLGYMIHRDEAVPEALAADCSIVAFAPESQASHDLQGLASWLLQQSSAN